MAAKIQVSKLLQEIRAYAELSYRHPQPRSPVLLLTQIRSHKLQSVVTKRRLSIRIDAQDRTDIPDQVKINHVKQGPGPAAIRPTP
jgi:hypothetical protein